MPSVAIIGTRGYPSYYGGFETAVRKLAPSLLELNWDVTVYGRAGAVRTDDPVGDKRVTSRLTRGFDTRSLSTLSYGMTSTLDAAARRPDVALVMNVANGFYLPALKARGIPAAVNVDGIEWERAKWSPLAQSIFRTGAKCTARWATELVFDSRAIATYWQQQFNIGGTFIPYGGDVPGDLDVPDGLQHRNYVLIVARFVPENSIAEFFGAVPDIAARYPVVIVGSSGYGGQWDEIAQNLADNIASVTWLGHINDDALLLALWQHAGLYFHGHSVGGTNPALVQAMAAGAPILARNTVYNREVLGQDAHFVEADANAISRKVVEMMESPDALDRASQSNVTRASEKYSWTKVCRDYETLLRGLIRD